MKLRARARHLRKNQTDAERNLWQRIRRRQIGGYRFRRQHPIGNYIVDFFCFEKGLVIEIDGGQHLEQADYDRERTNWLESQGYRVLRFWNNEVQDEVEAVVQEIWKELKNRKVLSPPCPHPNLPPQGFTRVGKNPLPLRRGRVRVGVTSAVSLQYHPHPSLPPSRGKGLTDRLFAHSCCTQNGIEPEMPIYLPLLAPQGEGTD